MFLRRHDVYCPDCDCRVSAVRDDISWKCSECGRAMRWLEGIEQPKDLGVITIKACVNIFLDQLGNPDSRSN